MSMSNLANMAEMNMSNPAIESEDEYVESCNFGTITSFVAVMHALLTGFVFIWSALLLGGHFPSEKILLFHWLMSSHCLHFPN